MNLKELAPYFTDEDAARRYFEAQRWPNGPVCPRCGAADPYKLTARPTAKKPVRSGLYKCKAKGCRKPFTVTVGTMMERSHIPLSTWLLAFHLMSSSKKGFSAHQMHREFGLDYKSAWFMAHRIREAMKREPVASKLKGIVEADETYYGGKPHKHEWVPAGRPGVDSKKTPVFALVERGGRVRSFSLAKDCRVTATNLRPIIREHVDPDTRIFTDEFSSYHGLHREFREHSTVNHGEREYARGEVSTNTIEGYFGLLKRGLNGTYHHVDRHHLGRYLSEFDFRYNARKLTDGQRTALAIRGAEGRRLTYREPVKSVTRL